MKTRKWGEEEPDEMGEKPPRRKLKKRFAHNNVLDAMSSFGPMRDAMKGILTSGL